MLVCKLLYTWFSIFCLEVRWNWLFNVTINDISVIYVTAHRCAGGLKKKLDLRSGSQRHRHFVGFFKRARPRTDTGTPFLYGDSDTPPHLVAFYDHAGDTEVHILDITPGPSRGYFAWKTKLRHVFFKQWVILNFSIWVNMGYILVSQ